MSEPADGSDQAIEIWKIKKVRTGEKSGEEGLQTVSVVQIPLLGRGEEHIDRAMYLAVLFAAPCAPSRGL